MKIVSLLPKDSMDLEQRTAVFKYRNESDTNWKVVNVTLSPILASRIANGSKYANTSLNSGVNYFNHEFVSYIDSKNYADNPFKLVVFDQGPTSDIPTHAHLECVDEKSEAVLDPFTKKILTYKNSYWKASQYLRMVVNTNVKKFADIDLKNIIDPDVRLEPISGNMFGQWKVKNKHM